MCGVPSTACLRCACMSVCHLVCPPFCLPTHGRHGKATIHCQCGYPETLHAFRSVTHVFSKVNTCVEKLSGPSLNFPVSFLFPLYFRSNINNALFARERKAPCLVRCHVYRCLCIRLLPAAPTGHLVPVAFRDRLAPCSIDRWSV